MPISVTSTDSSEVITTWVNGQPYTRTEVTKIYVIEPLDQPRPPTSDEVQVEAQMRQAGVLPEPRNLRVLAVGMVWVVWMAYIYLEYVKVGQSHG